MQPCVPRAPTTASPSSVAAEQQPRHPGPQQPLQERKPIESKKGPLNNATLPVLVIVTLALVLVVAVVIFKARTSTIASPSIGLYSDLVLVTLRHRIQTICQTPAFACTAQINTPIIVYPVNKAVFIFQA